MTPETLYVLTIVLAQGLTVNARPPSSLAACQAELDDLQRPRPGIVYTRRSAECRPVSTDRGEKP